MNAPAPCPSGEGDLYIEIQRARPLFEAGGLRIGDSGDVAVRITHLPTGLSATAIEKSGLAAKAAALAELKKMIESAA